ncbi:MAG: carboxymuconolactone decarboxylase family protein [Rhodospirillaceae bacterium]|jgi:alkylhydroperoxidase/carboxymuconolactone decarboxylase family protein YurZ|nr:carboxymuconolactone decarboxylase family protein [Rhodospirillaceae bacterium]MBT3778871.1 carboxymuconolactone decarboxylase family protein [Rhodospirillaceae bacterium]MBT3976461.1 carboxymuconolactone decarboxylase family protein [Rhodospirillaceae bacterium]MBT4170005.1 carboxymuconolactone decarboxylase family protein [Rhodospirillaceae bacterium]MBT4562610.1 carboxymuconolactone decarboxylase family protein [Rhodospirillaceae bacterium]
MADLNERQQAIKDSFIENRGYWAKIMDQLLLLSPDYFEAYTELSSVPWKHGVLEPKVKEFMYIAADASTTHLYNAGTRIHMQNALRHGATVDELFEVLQLTASLGIHSCTVGVPILLEELEAAGMLGEEPLDALQIELKEAFTKNRGYWAPFLDGLLRLSPEFFEAYLKISSVPWLTGPLEPKVKEFVYIAIDAATTHLYEPGLRQHIRNAIGHGASKEELMEVLELVTAIGVHTMTDSVPILVKEAEALASSS